MRRIYLPKHEHFKICRGEGRSGDMTDTLFINDKPEGERQSDI